MKTTLTLIASLLTCVTLQASYIQNASGAAMPIAKKQLLGDSFIYTAIAKKGYTFAVKNNRVIYMSIENANKHKASKCSHSALALSKVKATGRKTLNSARGIRAAKK